MSERLVFELQAIDRATAPLRAVQDQLDQTGAATRRLAGQMDASGKSTRKFAMGALQQAGFQIGDFAVQVANGTNKMQAFGQQAPQILQIFGPMGAVVGAGVAILAAFAVAADKSTSATSRLQEAMAKLKETSAGLADQLQMIRFGVGTQEEATTLQAILDLNDQIAVKTAQRDAAYGRARIPLDLELAALIKMRQEAEAALGLLDQRRADLAAVAQIEEQISRMATIRGNTAIEEIRDRQRAVSAHAEQVKFMGQTMNEQRLMNLALQEALDKSSKMRTVAAGIANEIGNAANAAARLASIGIRGVDASGNTIFDPRDPNYDPSRAARESQFGFEYNTSWMRSQGGMGGGVGGGGGAGREDALAQLREQLALEELLLGKTEAQRRVIQALGVDWQNYGATTVNGLVEQINRMEEFNKVAAQQREIANTIESAMTDAFMSMVQGTASVKDAFSNMARMIIAKLFEILVVQRIVNGIMGFVGMAVPGLVPAGVATNWNGGNITGGRPTVVGEKGPELIVPSRNAHVVANHQMGGGVTVVQNINVSTGVQQTVRSEIRSLMPQIAESAKAAVFESQRRSVNGMGYA